jgi:hypothetical protein
MHFFYLDEAGCTGADLANDEQPIFVLGGLGLRDEGWNKTQEEFSKIINAYFDGNVPDNFELHTCELLSPNGEGVFEGHPIENRLSLVREVLTLISDRSHSIHLFAIKKDLVINENLPSGIHYDASIPFLSAFDYLITYINDHVKTKLGSTARGMVIFDRKDQFHSTIESITHNRRFQGAKAKRVKWIVEFSYAVDSQKNPMIQISDLISVCARRFLEIEHGYRDGWPEVVKNFYAECYSMIHERISRKTLIERPGRDMAELNTFLGKVRCEPSRNWRSKYEF